MENKNFTISLHGIEVIERLYYSNPPLGDDPGYKFDVAAKAGIDPDRKLLIVLVEISLRAGDEPAILAKLATATAFEMPNIETELPKNDLGQYGVPPQLDEMVKSISISTARGILFSDLRGTPLHKAILPLIQLSPSIKG